MSIYFYAHMDSIGKRLRAAREQLGMNQTEFGALGGVQMRAQINYEQDKRQPDAAYLAAISAAGADILYILTGQRSSPPSSAPALAPDEAALLDNYRNCPQEGKQQLERSSALYAQLKKKTA